MAAIISMNLDCLVVDHQSDVVAVTKTRISSDLQKQTNSKEEVKYEKMHWKFFSLNQSSCQGKGWLMQSVGLHFLLLNYKLY